MRNAPVPTLGAEFIEIGREHINTILDYAHHLAAFKMGGQEFVDTFGLSESFIRQAMIYNERIEAAVRNAGVIAGISRQEEVQRPRRWQKVQIGA
mgnify:CR=1 FL=1